MQRSWPHGNSHNFTNFDMISLHPGLMGIGNLFSGEKKQFEKTTLKITFQTKDKAHLVCNEINVKICRIVVMRVSGNFHTLGPLWANLCPPGTFQHHSGPLMATLGHTWLRGATFGYFWPLRATLYPSGQHWTTLAPLWEFLDNSGALRTM